MDPAKRKRLAAVGWVETSLQDFLGATEAEMEAIHLAVHLGAEIQQRFRKSGTTPDRLAEECKLKPAVINRILNNHPRTKLEELFKVYFALGGRFADLHTKKRSAAKSRSK